MSAAACSRILLVLLPLQTSEEPGSVSQNVPYKTACGPIACYSAVRYLRGDATMDEIVQLCDWQEDQMTSLATMRDALQQLPDVDCQAVRLSPDQLVEYLGTRQYAAILPIRKRSNDIDHTVCAFDGNETGIVYIDYPELVVTVPMANLMEVWDGEVLLVSESWSHWLKENWWLCLIPFCCVCYLLSIYARRRRSGNA